MKTTFLMILFLLIASFRLGADTGLKSGFDSTGSFNNRLQFDGEIMDFSLLSSVSRDGLEWIEPDIFIKPLYIGRIQLKGIIREINNPDGISPSASVLTEPSGLRVTDSMSRSSRYGILLTPFNEYDFSAWMYRANSGLFSAGILYIHPDIIRNSYFRVEGEHVLTAGSYRDCRGSQWFGSASVFPGQTGINTAAEIRISTGESGYAGRRMLIPAEDELSGSLSITAAGAMPQYTAPGGLLRAVSAAGNRNFYINTVFQIVSSEYISASGSPSVCGFIAGTGITGLFEREAFGIKGEIDYYLKRRKPEIIPARYVEQAETVDCSLELCAGLFVLKLKGSCTSVFEISGMEVSDAGADASLKFDAGIIRADIGYGIDCTRVGSIVSWEAPGIDGGVSFVTEMFRFSLRCGYQDQSLSVKGNAAVVTGDYRISGSLAFEELSAAGLTIGFEI